MVTRACVFALLLYAACDSGVPVADDVQPDASHGLSDGPVHVAVDVAQDFGIRRFTALDSVPVMDLCAFDVLRLAVRYADGVIIEGEDMGDMRCITHARWDRIPKGTYDLQVFSETDDEFATVYLRLYPGVDPGLLYIHR